MGSQHRTGLVGEGEFNRVVDVREIFDAFRRSVTGHLKSTADWGVEFAQPGGIVTIRRADQGKRWRMEIPHRTAFAEKFGVAVIEQPVAVGAAGFPFQDGDDPRFRRAGRHGGAHDHAVRAGFAANGLADCRGHSIDGHHRHAAIGGTGRANGDEGNIGREHGRRYVAGGGQASGFNCLGDQRIDFRFDNRRLAGVQHGHFIGGHIHTDDGVAE